MAANIKLPANARKENAKRLAAATGMTIDQADEQLDLPVVVSVAAGHAAGRLAEELIALLSRTFATVTTEPVSDAAVEALVGNVRPRTAGKPVFATIEAERLTISMSTSKSVSPTVSPPGLLLVIAACYLCAAVVKQATGIPYPFAEPFILDFEEFGLQPSDYSATIDLGETHLAGAGAIGNGFLWAARHLDIRGQLHVVDDDVVDAGNLQRQIFFAPEDEGLPKAEVLAKCARALLPHLTLIPHRMRLQELSGSGPWLRRLISAVDSPEARRSLQKEMPREVFDASTTGIEEVVVHHHSNPTETACMACVYQKGAKELSLQQHMADHLGLTLEQVLNNRINHEMAVSIAARFPGQIASEIEGLACDSLYKQLCGAGILTTPAGQQILAPFAFVSVLAGALIALELLRRLGVHGRAPFNVWRVGCWAPPARRLWRQQGRSAACEVCGDSGLRDVSRLLWQERTPTDSGMR
jgi:hypothetical protein